MKNKTEKLLKKFEKFGVDSGSVFRTQIEEAIGNDKISFCELKLLKRTIRLLKLTLMNAPQQALLKEIDLIESAVTETRTVFEEKIENYYLETAQNTPNI